MNLSRRASASSTRSPSVSASIRWMASCSISAFRRCSSTRPRAASRCASRRPSTCAWGASGRSAAEILRDEDEATIADILFHFGEERAARRIARAIVADRETKPFTSTLELAGMIARVAPARRGELTHPATRAFQALRIAVNDELRRTRTRTFRRRAFAQIRRPPRGCDVPFARGPDRQAVLGWPLRPRTGRLAPPAWRAGFSRADIRGSARPADRSRAKRRRAQIRARARRNCGLGSARARRRRDGTRDIEALARLPARRGR